MARTTADNVKAIIDVDVVEVPDLTPFIDTANALVTEVCEPAGYDATRLELIERWLAAHFYAVRDPRAIIEGVSSFMTHYQHKEGLILSVTHYGQHAMLLDTKGGLAALSKQIEKGQMGEVSAHWLGTPHDEGEI